MNFSHCSEAVRHLFLRHRCNELSAGIAVRGTAAWECWVLNICPAALMRKWTPTSLHPGLWPKAWLWAALLPFRRHGLSQAVARTHRTTSLKCFSLVLTAWSVTNFESLFYTGWYHVFGVHSIIVPQKPFHLEGLLSPSPEGAGQGAGCRQAAAAQGKQPHKTTFYTSHLFEMPTIRRIKSVLHASQQQ